MEKQKQSFDLVVDSVQTLEQTLTLSLEALRSFQALPSYIEGNAQAVRRETLEEFARWFEIS